MPKSKPKAQVEEKKPVVSSLPISTGDTPLVIDLPDGQKLVVGNLESGTVIEVATWRGTGRPDSRTSRLMLGVSSTDELQEESQNTSSNAQSEPSANSPVDKIKGIILGALKNFKKRVSDKSKEERREKKKKQEVESTETDKFDDDEFETRSVEPSALNGIDSEIDDLLRSLKSDAFSPAVEVPVKARTSSLSKSASKGNSGSTKKKSPASEKKTRR